MWEDTIEENFMKMCQYISLCTWNGITFNIKKFQFCQQEVEFMGFMLSNFGVRPTEEMLSSIKDFPRPRDIMGIRSFFGLVEQVVWAFSKTEEMAPFQQLLSPKAQYCRTNDMEEAFVQAKK